MRPDARITTLPLACSRPGPRVYAFAAALLALFLLSATPASAAVEAQLAPSPAAPQPVGTTVIWTASATDTNPGTLEYQFSVRPPAGNFAVVRDFSPSDSFEWTPSEREGDYDIRVIARNETTLETAQLVSTYSVSSRVTGDDPVVNTSSNPLVALYSAPACDAGSMRVRFWRAGDFSSRVTSWKSCQPGVSRNFYVAGMLAGTEYNLRHEVSSDPTLPVAEGPTLSFTTGTPSASFPATTVLTAPPAGSSQDMLLHSHIGFLPNAVPPFLVATNLSGQLLWYYERSHYYNLQPVAGGTMLVLADNFTLREIDLAGNTVRETNTKAVSDQLAALGKHAITAFHHDARPLPDGSTVVLSSSERVLTDVQGPGPVTVVGDTILVLDKDWQVTWAWDSFDHLDVTRKALLDEKCPQLCYTTAPLANDWTHSNSVTYSPADGNLLLSVRHQDWVVKIDYGDGEGAGDILGGLGKDGDFTNDSADPYPWFSHQHDASYEPGSDQKITLYDNGNTRQLFPNLTANSRGQVWEIDETAHTATLKVNADLGGYSSALGSAQKLADGGYHFNSGFLSFTFTHSIGVSPDGSLNFVLRSQAASYRSFRMRDLYTRDDPGPDGGEAQTITFKAVADKIFGDAPFAVTASASSGLPVTLRVVSGPATVSGNTVTVDGVGTVVLQADQYGNIKYRQAQSVRRSFVVHKASQTITFDALPDKTYGDPDFTVTATASSGLPVSFSAADDCTVKSGKVHLTAAGTCAITATQAGDSNYNPAVVTQSFDIARAAQTITFAALTNKTFGDAPFVLGATSSSGLPVSFSVASGPASLSGNTLTITGAGAVTVRASQAGNSDYNAAPNVERTFTVAKAGQTITFGALADKTFGDPNFQVSATASSGLAVSFAASGNCTVTGTTVHITGAGVCAVTASQAGGTNYNAAPVVERSFQVAKAAATAAVSSSANPSAYGQSLTFTATVISAAGTPTGAVQFRANGANLGAPVPLNAGGVATLTTPSLPAGTHAVAADYGGDSNFKVAAGALSVGQVVGATLEFTKAAYAVGERDGSVTITVRRTGDTSQAVSVDYFTDDGSTPSSAVPCSSATGLALERCDFTRAASTLRFAAGEQEKGFVILVSDDSFTEGAETVSLRLSAPSLGAALGAQTAVPLSITDDAAETLANPIDDDETFVRQHYRDFLNREADADGLKFWTDGLKACGSDAGCRDVKRVHTSAAFFLSIEFQETGFFIHRLTEASFDRLPRYRDFVRDSREVAQGVVVGQDGWELRLEANIRAFVEAWAARAEFKQQFDQMSNAQYVDALFRNAGAAPGADELQTLVAGLDSAAETRATVLRKVADAASFKQAEKNRAFVLMQYFGYLRRDPDAAPNTDMSGYNFWLEKLVSHDGDFVRAEMVRAFLISDEYRKRFGQ